MARKSVTFLTWARTAAGIQERMQAQGDPRRKTDEAAKAWTLCVVLGLLIKKEVKKENIRSLSKLCSRKLPSSCLWQTHLPFLSLLSPAAPFPRFALCSAPAVTYKYASSDSPCPSQNHSTHTTQAAPKQASKPIPGVIETRCAQSRRR
jgi:hypothetical protein